MTSLNLDYPDLFEDAPTVRPYRPNGRELAKRGAQLAAEHAERVSEGWGERAYALLLEYAAARRLWTAEELWTWSEEECALPRPPDRRAWGAVILRALRAGVMTRDSYTTSRVPGNHARPIPLWRTR